MNDVTEGALMAPFLVSNAYQLPSEELKAIVEQSSFGAMAGRHYNLAYLLARSIRSVYRGQKSFKGLRPRDHEYNKVLAAAPQIRARVPGLGMNNTLTHIEVAWTRCSARERSSSRWQPAWPARVAGPCVVCPSSAG